MKRSLAYSVLVIGLAFTYACKKTKTETADIPPEETPEPVVYPSYSKLKAGNYWIYGRYQVDANNNVSDLHQYDSSYVEKDTLIRNHVYYKLHKKDFSMGPISFVLYLRDSLHYIVTSSGRAIFSSEDFTTLFADIYITGATWMSDTIYKVTTKMNDKDLIVTVPAGTFQTSSYQSTFTYPPSKAVPGIPNPRISNMRYAKNKGLIIESEYFYTGAPMITEKRLIRYHVN